MNQPPNFDRLAGPYRWMERLSFGPFLALCRSTFLSHAAICHHALILGDGDGRFTARLLRANPHIRIDTVDISSSMLQAQIGRAGPNATRLRSHQADARTWTPDRLGAPSLGSPRTGTGPWGGNLDSQTWESRYDVIVTHFFLDCLTTEEVQSLATRIRPNLTPAAIWIVSEFAVPHSRYGRLIARPLIGLLYRAFGLLTGLAVRTLPNHDSALTTAGFTQIEHRPRLAGLLVTELWSVNPSNPA